MLASHHDALWVCLCDFNDILSSNEKRDGCPQPSRLINGFRKAISDSGLIEFPMRDILLLGSMGEIVMAWWNLDWTMFLLMLSGIIVFLILLLKCWVSLLRTICLFSLMLNTLWIDGMLIGSDLRILGFVSQAVGT